MIRGIDIVVYFYIFICLALMVYNVIYILSSKRKKQTHSRRGDQWLRELTLELDRLEQRGTISTEHQNRMYRKLPKIHQLMAYQVAMTQVRDSYPQSLVQRYLDENLPVFQVLGLRYGEREPMERAYYAYLMAEYHPCRDRKENQLIGILMGYLEHSTIFCRENVLQAFYAMGQPGAIENALTLIHNRGWYHSTRLLSDGLASFVGDKQDLAVHLWHRCQDWNENLQVAVVQFAALVSAPLEEEFYGEIQRRDLNLETRFAIIRYFQRSVYPPVKEVLCAMVAEEDGNGLAIAAATALSRYPGEDTFRTLLQAVRSRNYHIRRNAAASLVTLGATDRQAEALREAGDPYAAEMLEYMLHGSAPEPVSGPGTETKEVVCV